MVPQVFRIDSYTVYFWTNEGTPLEPVHVHIAEGSPVLNATKVWITKAGRCCLCNNNSCIPENVLHNLLRMIEAWSEEIVKQWQTCFGKVRFYC